MDTKSAEDAAVADSTEDALFRGTNGKADDDENSKFESTSRLAVHRGNEQAFVCLGIFESNVLEDKEDNAMKEMRHASLLHLILDL